MICRLVLKNVEEKGEKTPVRGHIFEEQPGSGEVTCEFVQRGQEGVTKGRGRDSSPGRRFIGTEDNAETSRF